MIITNFTGLKRRYILQNEKYLKFGNKAIHAGLE